MRLSNANPGLWSVTQVAGQPSHSWMHENDPKPRPRPFAA